MKNFYLTLMALSFTFLGFSQNYSYSFSGELSAEQRIKFERDISKLSGVREIKLKYKEERNAGELLITISNPERAEGDDSFSALTVKNVLLSYSLEPINFIELK